MSASSSSSSRRMSVGSGRTRAPSMSIDDAQDDPIKLPTPSGNQEKFACKTWIWVDLVSDYVEQMIKYGSREKLAKLEEELSALQQELEVKNELISSGERDMVEHIRVHQIEICELKSQILALQSHIAGLTPLPRRSRSFACSCFCLLPCAGS